MTHTKKLAILYYGQLRLNPREDENFKLLIQRTSSFSEVDIYVHAWSFREGEKYQTAYWSDALVDHKSSTFAERLEYVNRVYKPVAISVEEQRDFDHQEFLHPETSRNRDYAPIEDTPQNISIMLSQLYSINAVCNLVPVDKEYDIYILIRHDMQFLSDKIPEDFNGDHEILCRGDFMHVFKFPALKAYQNLMRTLKEKKISTYNFINSYFMRKFSLEDAGFNCVEADMGCLLRKCRQEITLEYIDTQLYNIYFNESGIYIRKYCHSQAGQHYVCRAAKRDKPEGFRWIGTILSNIGSHEIKFRVKFTKILPSVPIGSKSHSPDTFYLWSASENLELNVWKPVEIKVETSRYNDLFIFVFLDDYISQEDLEFELQIIT